MGLSTVMNATVTVTELLVRISAQVPYVLGAPYKLHTQRHPPGAHCSQCAHCLWATHGVRSLKG